MLSRRSLLVAAPLLVLPKVSVKASLLMAPTGPCGSPIPVFTTNASEITGPGCYALQNDITDIPALSTMGGLTILGNGHAVTRPTGQFLQIGFGLHGYVITIRDLIVNADGIEISGNVSTTQTSPCVYLYNCTMNATGTGSVGSLVHMGGSNIVLERCTVNTYASGPTTGYDDGGILSPFSGVGNVPASYVTFDTCTFGPNWDVAIEGYSTLGAATSPHWNHVTIKNCQTTAGAFAIADFGGYYGDGVHNTFTFGNCTFTGNTLSNASSGRGGWFFADGGGGLSRQITDAGANAQWGGGSGNVFGSPAGPPNIYL
jgi:hypothetical protein